MASAPARPTASAVAASAGKNDSMASSETVTSTGVPNVVTVLKNASSPSPALSRRGMTMSGAGPPPAAGPDPAPGSWPSLPPWGYSLSSSYSAARSASPVVAACRPRRSSRCRRHAFRQEGDGAVARDHVPGAVDHDRRVRLVSGQHQLDRIPDRLHLRLVECPLPLPRRLTGPKEELVAFTQRNAELVGEMEHHLRARTRAAGLNEAEMSSRDAGLQGQVELAEPPSLPPATQERADRHARADVRHRAPTISVSVVTGTYPGGNRQGDRPMARWALRKRSSRRQQ